MQREVCRRSEKGKEEKDAGLHERRRTAGGITGAGIFYVLESRHANGLHTPVHLQISGAGQAEGIAHRWQDVTCEESRHRGHAGGKPLLQGAAIRKAKGGGPL